ncbi:C-factor [Phytophthora ramorum]|uniref:C-factor n=1 Tax=Phytophthora ramorum TaxID=164328 RepID=UPI0030B35129|nr:C-factor [Phytophthora ramorum]
MGKWLTIEEKYEVIAKHRRSPALSQVKLAQWAKAAFNLERAPSANTVKKVLQAAEEIEQKHRQGITKRGRDVVSPELETMLKGFVDQCGAEEVRLSRKLLVQKAQQILMELPADRRPKLGLSVGWMTNFMARHGIRFRQFRRRRTEDNSLGDNEGQPQRTVTDVTDHLALARDTPGRQIVHTETPTVTPARGTDIVVEPMKKVVLVTGAGQGIGLAFVRHYMNEGWNVIATVRDVAKAEELRVSMPWRLMPLDVAEQQSIQEAARMLTGVPIDLLINNAGSSGLHNLADTTAEDSQVTSRIGSISDNSSGGAYAQRASKGALNVFTKSLAIDLEPQKIGCVLLHPGNVNTAYSSFRGAVEPEESVQGMARIIARAKIGEPLLLRHFGKGDVIDW